MTIAPSTPPDRGYMGDPRRGASLGRASHGTAPEASPIHLRRLRLDSQGYDKGGAYWGIGGELFEAFDDAGTFYETVRIYPRDRTAAFNALGGKRVGEEGYVAGMDWSREAAKLALRDGPDGETMRFYR